MPLMNVGGYSQEPALSLANDVIQELLGGYPWRCNRAELPLMVTQQGRQDYQFAGASAWTVNGGVGIGLAATPAISESGNTVTVNTLDPHNFAVGDTVYMVADYNSTFAATPSQSTWSGGWVITAAPTPTSFEFTHASSGLNPSGAPGITDVCWLQSATMVNMNDRGTPQTVKYLRTVRTLPRSSITQTPDHVMRPIFPPR